jgi:hypothetical protein
VRSQQRLHRAKDVRFIVHNQNPHGHAGDCSWLLRP